MEVILSCSYVWLQCRRFLHVCGGDPKNGWSFKEFKKFSPRMWRWSRYREINNLAVLVFSTYVEVILTIFVVKGNPERFLHVCGGDPQKSNKASEPEKFSPRMWRWSWVWHRWYHGVHVFSTYVEVILKPNTRILNYVSFLHVCGGDPRWKC